MEHSRNSTEPLIVEALGMIRKGIDKGISNICNPSLDEKQIIALCRTAHLHSRVLPK